MKRKKGAHKKTKSRTLKKKARKKKSWVDKIEVGVRAGMGRKKDKKSWVDKSEAQWRKVLKH